MGEQVGLKIGPKLRKTLERRHWVRFWGQRRICRPVLIGRILGDGMKLLAVTPLNTRPNYYLIRIDSSWHTSNYESPCVADNMDEIYDAIEEEVGPGGYISKEESHTGRAHFEYWPALNSDCGSSWSDANDLLPARLFPKRAQERATE